MIDGAAEQPLGAAGPESLRVFRSCPRITPKDAQSSLQMLAIARYACALRLDRTPFERAARSRPKNSQALRPTGCPVHHRRATGVYRVDPVRQRRQHWFAKRRNLWPNNY